MYRQITARFHGTCRMCRASIRPGQVVMFEPGTKGLACVSCVDASKVKPATPASPSSTTAPKLKVKKVRLASFADPDDIDPADLDDPSTSSGVPPVTGTLQWPSSTDDQKNYTISLSNGQAVSCNCTGHSIRKKCSHVDQYNRGVRKTPNVIRPKTFHSYVYPPGVATKRCVHCSTLILFTDQICRACGAAQSSPPPPAGSQAKRSSASKTLADLAAKIKAGGLDLDDLSDLDAADIRRRMKQAASAQPPTSSSSSGQRGTAGMPNCYYCHTPTLNSRAECSTCHNGPKAPPTHYPSFDQWECLRCRTANSLSELECGKCDIPRGNTPSSVWKARAGAYAPSPPSPPPPPPQEVKLPPSWFKAMEAFQDIAVDMLMKPNPPPSLKPALEKYMKLSTSALRPGNDHEGRNALRFAMIEIIKICFDRL